MNSYAPVRLAFHRHSKRGIVLVAILILLPACQDGSAGSQDRQIDSGQAVDGAEPAADSAQADIEESQEAPPIGSNDSASVIAAPDSDGSSLAAAADADTDSKVMLSITDLEGLTNQVQQQSGKVVVVDIWSTSCLPCMREFPNLIALGQQYPERVACISFNVDFIGISSKPPESYRERVMRFLEKQNASITNLLSSTPDEEVLEAFEAEAIPAILIYDQQGKLQHRLTDANSGDDGLSYAGDVIPIVESLLK